MSIGFHLSQDYLEVSGLDAGHLSQYLIDEQLFENTSPELYESGLRIRLPPAFFDGRRHQVRLIYTLKGVRNICVFEHQSIYSGQIEKHGAYLRGYIYDHTRPDTPLVLDVELDGHVISTLLADEIYDDAPEAAKASGFILSDPTGHKASNAHILAFRLSGTDFYPLGRILINIQSASLSIPDNIVPDPFLKRLISDFRTFYIRRQSRLARLGKPSEPLPEIWCAGGSFHGSRQTTGTDVIVPVYKGYEETFACLNSVLSAHNDQPLNLIVINDKSPDAILTRDLRRHAAHHNYHYLENDENLGFVRTVNKGMRLNRDNDVVLLNSDTEVSDGWLDRLYQAVHSDSAIGSASPLSNQATILNLPDTDGHTGIPYGLNLKAINELCTTQNDRLTLDLPTTHGFCMFIRRDCLNQCGLFDEMHFNKGYGEENEFCLRSADRGWRHVAALDVFVYHKNGVSFGQTKTKALHANLKVLKTLYPDYEDQITQFLRHDPMTPVRNRLQLAQWRDKPCVIFFTPSLGGGIETHAEALAQKLTAEGYRVLLASGAPNGVERDTLSHRIREWGTDNSATYLRSGPGNDFYVDLLSLKPQFMHLHHLIDMPDGADHFLQNSGIPYYVTLHDYFYVSPTVTLLNEGEIYNAAATPDDLRDNSEHRLIHPALHPDYQSCAKDIGQWHEKWGRVLRQAHTVIAPDPSVIDIYKSLFPDAPYLLRAHDGPDTAVVGFRERPQPDTIRVAVIGTLTAAKGMLRFLNLARWAKTHAPNLHFIVHGYAQCEDALKKLSNVDYHGPYAHNELRSRLAEIPCHTAMFLSGWPETYSYTLTEALKAGLTPVCLDVGAFSTRLATLEIGERLPLNATAQMLSVALCRAATQAITPDSYSEGGYDNLIADYYDFTPTDTSASEAAATWLPISKGLHTDGWCTQQTVLEFQAPEPVNCLKLSLYLPEGRPPQSVMVYINDEASGRYDLPANVLCTPEISTPPLSGRIHLRLTFDNTRPLSQTDPRTASARLTGVQFSYDANLPGGTKGLETPQAVRELQSLYTDVTRYALSRERETFAEAIGGSVTDLVWTARLIRQKGPKGALRALQAMRYLRRSSFDTVFYGLQQKDSRHPRLDPITHYVVFGAAEALDPAPGFSTRFYLQAHDDIARTGINPFYHYLRNGAQENRRTEPSDKINLFLQTRNGSAKLRGALRLAGLGKLGHATEELAPTWPKRDTPEKPVTAAGDVRPEDEVLDEAAAGEAFLKAFSLLGRSPQWKKAVDELNHRPYERPENQVDVSIIVPVYGQLAYTLNLLDSLLQHTSKYRFEILIGDDASPDQSGAWLSRINNVKHIRYEQNEGFIANCNKTAAQARGDYVVLLNNDTRVCAGWLDGLIDTFGLFPNVGLTGSKLLYPDGSLQEAGGIVWQDGSAWNYGRNDDPNRPEYCRARNVDYISGASIALKKDLWDQLGGFDTHYSPAYYEDTDLSFRIREQGHAVIMQPASRIIHYEGKTSGTDTTSGVKAYQTINREKFYARWKNTLLNHRPNGEKPELENDRPTQKRVLILDAVNPRINQDAGSNATRDLFLYYQALGYGVSFLPEDNFLYEPEYVKPMQAQGVEALYAPYVPSLSALLSARPDYYDVIHLIRPLVAHRNIETVRRLAPKAKIAYLNADLHYLRMERQSIVENRPALMAEAAAMKAKELALNEAVDITFVHSTHERELLLAQKPDARIYVLPLIDQIVENDVPHPERMDVMFLGGYNHPPNLDAARWLLQDIWPTLSERLPQARLLLIGANPPAELKALASERVVVTGRVDNLSEWFNRSRIFVAPLRYGAGAKGKLIAAMGHGVPVIATDIAAEGLGLTPDEAIFLANTPDEFTRKAIRLFKLPAREWKTLSGVVQERVRIHHSFESGLAVMREALG